MKLTESEYLTLIEESVGGKFTECFFGPCGAKLKDTPENDWAKKRVNEMRNPVQI